ncbi:DUF2867 domain-containing protein [Streptomyces orinoci]|uniref:DUF2867 domain-containing protein n=1 Tax=Streptomyces orinoci TaxID=67339 RepID=A0ABV3JZC6_STRON|nr:DUF2867 domain-containing protein [Streptomyces orinoci]
MARLATAAFTEQPWRIHEITEDFSVEDVWRFRTPGAGPDDFPVVAEAIRAAGGIRNQPALARLLFAARWRFGALLGWDAPSESIGSRVASFRDRLPADLRDAPRGWDEDAMPLKAVYELRDESARELANKTVHTVMHLGWAPGSTGDHELRMTVLVKANGRFGRLYMSRPRGRCRGRSAEGLRAGRRAALPGRTRRRPRPVRPPRERRSSTPPSDHQRICQCTASCSVVNDGSRSRPREEST